MSIEVVTESDFAMRVLGAPGAVVVNFTADWCGPCRMMAPTLEEVAGAVADAASIVSVNTDQSPGIAARHGVTGVPTLMMFRRGKVVARHVGVLPRTKLQRWITETAGQRQAVPA